jgi:hypothetical protein
MATQYTSILKLALPTQGELSGTWGDVVNDNITSMVEEAIAGRSVINSWAANSHTLTTADGLTSESRAAMLEFTDTGTALSGAATVICPTATKIYVCKNGAGQTVTVKTAAGTGVAIPNGETMFVFCDGTNVVQAVTSLTTLKVGTGIQVSTILDEDNMASDSATALATQQSIKAYVDAQITAQDLDFAGDTGTGAVDLDSQTFTVAGTANEIETSASGQTITIGLPTAIVVTTITTTNVQATNIKANDGTAAITIADSTGQVTVTDAVLTTADINGGTADNVTIGGSTAAAGSFTTLGASGTTTLSGALALTGNLDINTNKFNVTAVNGNTLIAGTLGVTGNVDLNGGTIDGTVIGGSTAAAITGTTITGTSFVSSGDMTFGDDDKAIFGAGSDLQIYHDGSNSWINEVGTGQLILAGEDVRITTPSAGEFMATFGVNGAATLYYDNASKLATTATGIDVTGGVTATSLKATDNINIQADDAQLYLTNAANTDYFLIKRTGASGDLAFDHFNGSTVSERLRITATGNVGIGTSSPANKLDVRNTSTDYQLHLGDTASTVLGYELGRESTGGLFKFYGNQTGATGYIFSGVDGERMRIDVSGNVGIGNSNPSNYNAVGSNRLVVGTNVGNNGITIVGATTGFSSLAFADSAGSGGNDDYAGLIQYSHITNNMNFFTNSTQKMVLDSSGNVGIGTSSPTGKFHVVGGRSNFAPNSENFAVYLQYNSATSGFYVGSPSADAMAFSASSGAERMRIDASGNLILGGTTAITDTGTPSLTIGNGAGNPSLNFYGTSAGQAGQISFGDATSGTGAYEGYLLYDNANNFMAFGTNHTERVRIDSSGHLIVPNGITLGTAVGTYNAANTLDDYEEGTWTPALTFETAGDLSVVYAAERIGTYRKIGDLVIAQFSVQCSTFTHTTASGNLQMTGLPFASVRNSSDFSGVGLNSFQGITKANYTQIGATTLNGASYIFFSICGSGQAAENVAAADMPSGTLKLLRGTVIYRA